MQILWWKIIVSPPLTQTSSGSGSGKETRQLSEEVSLAPTSIMNCWTKLLISLNAALKPLSDNLRDGALSSVTLLWINWKGREFCWLACLILLWCIYSVAIKFIPWSPKSMHSHALNFKHWSKRWLHNTSQTLLRKRNSWLTSTPQLVNIFTMTTSKVEWVNENFLLLILTMNQVLSEISHVVLI